jgi:arabinoxylan arabinofuranohydrolase
MFTADPSAKVFGDRVYVYTSHDADGQTDFDMVDYHAFSSDDMVNWRDHGVIISTADLSWATKLFAPDACEKDGKYYLYMPNSGNGIGVAVADDPGGPFVDPLGRPLVTRSTPGVEDVEWLFDPACFVDDDGQGYLYFGGGPQDTGDNARVMRLGADMISLADTAATRIVAPAFFEAAYMHKRGGIYYFSYSTNFVGHPAYLDYMTSDKPMTGFRYRGTILNNGGINGNNNNHGSIIELAGKSYLFYHNRKLEQDGGGTNSYQRSVAVQELTYDESGAIPRLTMTTEATTVDQVKCLNGLARIEAETIATQHGVEVQGNGKVGVSVTAIDDGDWIAYSQVDFGTRATTFAARVAAASSGSAIEIRIGGCDEAASVPGSVIGTCAVPGTGGAQTWLDLSCPVSETSGAHDLCLRFKGSSSFALDHFHFE